MGEVGPPAGQGLHGGGGGFPVAGNAQVIAVNVCGMRQAEIVGGGGQLDNYLARSDTEAGHGGIDAADIGPRLLPVLGATGVDELDAKSASCLEEPGQKSVKLFSAFFANEGKDV